MRDTVEVLDQGKNSCGRVVVLTPALALHQNPAQHGDSENVGASLR